MYANPGMPASPYPMRYNPYRHNPLSLGAKIAIGVATVGAVGLGAYFLWPREAKAAERPGLPTPTPTPTPMPVPTPTPGVPRAPGHPPPYGIQCMPPTNGGSSAYDQAFWDTGGTEAARARIFSAFESLGYASPIGSLGPNRALGGGDNPEHPVIREFQGDYNAVSLAGNFLPNMGGLDNDGFIGPCTLTAVKYVLDNIGGENWFEIADEARS